MNSWFHDLSRYMKIRLWNMKVISLWNNICWLQAFRGGRHLKISTWQDYMTYMEPRAKRAWKYTFILLFFLYKSMSLWLNIIYSWTVKGRRHLEICTWQDYRTCRELALKIAVQIQYKFKLVIQGTWRQGKITLFS